MNLQRDYELEEAEIEHGIQIEVQVRARAG
jgi:hypothetical protein